MRFSSTRLALLVVLSTSTALLASDASADETVSWPGLRGPSYDGTVRDGRLFPDGAGSLAVAWKSDLGSGYPVVAVDAQRAITMFADGDDDVMAAFDRDSGERLWRYRINDTYKGHTGSHDGPISTPTVAGGRVFGLGPRGDLFALEAATGNEIWKIDLIGDLGAEAPFYGFATSPLVVAETLVVEVGAGAEKTIVAFDVEDGRQLWAVGDDKVAYHSPIVAALGGRQQVLAVGQKTIMGLDPATGEVLWSHEHEGDERAMGGETIVPVPAGENRLLLLNTEPESQMLRVETVGAGNEWQITKLWSSRGLRSTYVVPVYHEGYLYGMAGKIFTCVDAETGETQWKAREPGDGFPTLVGDQLVIMTKPGTLIVADTDPTGYREVTRLDLFADHSWSAPAFADGSLYVRSMGEIARVDLVGGELATGATADWLKRTEFGAFLGEVADAADKAAVIDSYLDKHQSFPIIEPTGAVHFVYRGEAEDVGIVGDMIGFRREDPMTRVDGTDLFYYSTRLEPNASVNYGFLIDYGEPTPDPGNSTPAAGVFGDVSWFAMPAWQGPEHLAEAELSRRGRIESIEWESTVREGQTRPARVYLPAGYDDSDQRYPVLYVFRGDEALEQGSFKNTLDNLIGDRISPVVAVMVLPVGEEPRADMRDEESFLAMVTQELVPMIDERYRTLTGPSHRGVASTGSGADVALNAAFRHPETFGRVGAIWPGLFAYDYSVIPSADQHPLVIYQAWGTYHLRSPHEGFSSIELNRKLQHLLREAGYRPAGGEEPEGLGWMVYRNYTDDMLISLFPRR